MNILEKMLRQMTDSACRVSFEVTGGLYPWLATVSSEDYSPTEGSCGLTPAHALATAISEYYWNHPLHRGDDGHEHAEYVLAACGWDDSKRDEIAARYPFEPDSREDEVT